MKKILKYTLGLLAILMVFSCYDGIDPITEVDPGPDAGAPTVDIMKPADGFSISDPEPISSLEIEFVAEDDIELILITVSIDGSQIASYDSFTDYRVVSRELVYDNVEVGEHTLEVTATDIVGNVFTKTHNFSKEPPYVPMYATEIFYMPFDGDYTELVSSTAATETGAPGFAGESFAGLNALQAATSAAQDNYVSFPIADLELSTTMSGAFWYKVDATATRSGILTIGANADDRFQGFRLFREGNDVEQRIKLNVGTGTGESWNDGGVIAVADNEWVHVAFTISDTETKIYFNGVLQLTSTLAAPIDWTGCTELNIGAGGPTFSYWDHLGDTSAMDELRLFSSALSQNEIIEMIAQSDQVLYMPFDGSFNDVVSDITATETGTPGFAGDFYEGINSFQAATTTMEDSYLSVPFDGLGLGDAFSGTFWYKVNATATRSGILTVGANADDRLQGFRLFREGNDVEQRIKLNVGIGSGESWNDGGVITVANGEWVHVAFTVSATESKIYFNGELQLTSTFSSPVDWTGCTELNIGAGGPTFSYWDHWGDTSAMDELRIFDKELSQEEIQSML
ncbi:LamG domain-containing protein [Mangrovimonas xylaniphaga]|uniref:LamG domain-containing protein n=1 Tax=Mangrovimonas xylaniphaga TaxID=1645915 RepID=UPI0006B5F02D|nr:LamG domain-containing protein [Mangrovimonas xylaniphaga]